MLRKLYNEYDFAVERILLKEYRKLSLSMKELTVLVALFAIYKKRKTFSTLAIARRVEYNSSEIGEVVESLLDKGFMTLDLESKDGKDREVFDLSLTFEKIEDLFKTEEKERLKAVYESDISDVILEMEKGIGRPLKSYELDNIRKWFEDDHYDAKQVKKAIEQAEDRVSVKTVERLLTQIPMKQVEIDADVDQALDEIFKSIK